ncbi:MAG: response regulator, partial [Vicinamibacterales bacterium]
MSSPSDAHPLSSRGPVESEEGSLITTLVIDDEDSVRDSLSRFLASMGHETVTAGDGGQAVAEIRRRKIACILLDIQLPDSSGLDLVPVLLEQEPFAAILMLTAVNDAHSAALCMQRGAMDYLVKPVDLQDLQRAIVRALARRREA